MNQSPDSAEVSAVSLASSLRPCPVCRAVDVAAAFRDWLECRSCLSVFAQRYPCQKTGGSNEEMRNLDDANEIRRQRLVFENPASILDYGAGHGLFVRYLCSKGHQATGWEPGLPLTDAYNAVSCIEVCEHFQFPGDSFEHISAALKPNGILMLESSFRDGRTLDQLAGWSYADIGLGHHILYSINGLIRLTERAGLYMERKINDNVYIFRKRIPPC